MEISIKTICVFCGSSEAANQKYQAETQYLGKQLAENSIHVVYGGASIGLMGTLADAVISNNGRVTGVIPESLERKEVAHNNLDKLIVTRSMHERKATMATLSDAYVILPDGFGTLEELFEVITWSQLQIHKKPIILVNLNGFFGKMLTFLDAVQKDGFIHNNMEELYTVVDNVDECMQNIITHSIEETETFNQTMI